MKEDTLRLIEHYKSSKAKSDLCNSKITEEILNIHGMTSAKTRHFYNNLLEYSIPNRNTQYLEIGSWKGSSLISALYKNNHVDAVCIDDWSLSFSPIRVYQGSNVIELEGPREEFMSNCDKLISKDINLEVIESDCFSTNLDRKFDIYLYDGDHSHESQAKALTHFENNLADSCLVVIDDWNSTPVKEGTLEGLSKIDFEVKFVEEVFSKGNADLDGYWNGMGVFVLERK